MAKIGQFKNEQARVDYLRAYDALTALWTIAPTAVEVPTSFGSTRVHRFGSGTGVPLVLLHPMGGTSLTWQPFIDAFARDRVVYALDTIGCAGRSVQSKPITDPADYGTWFEDVVAGLGLEKVHLFGYSDGSWHAGLVGSHAPQRIVSLVVGEPGAWLSGISKGLLMRMLWIGLRPTHKNFAKFNAWMSPGVELHELETNVVKASMGFRRRTPWLKPFDDQQLRSISVPTLAFFGSETVLGDPDVAARRAVEHIPDVEVEIFPGLGHSALWQDPGATVGRLLTFIGQHDHRSVS